MFVIDYHNSSSYQFYMIILMCYITRCFISFIIISFNQHFNEENFNLYILSELFEKSIYLSVSMLLTIIISPWLLQLFLLIYRQFIALLYHHFIACSHIYSFKFLILYIFHRVLMKTRWLYKAIFIVTPLCFGIYFNSTDMQSS